MRILQTPARLFATGGVESYIRNLSDVLVEMGQKVSIICADTPRDNEVNLGVTIVPEEYLFYYMLNPIP